MLFICNYTIYITELIRQTGELDINKDTGNKINEILLIMAVCILDSFQLFISNDRIHMRFVSVKLHRIDLHSNFTATNQQVINYMSNITAVEITTSSEYKQYDLLQHSLSKCHVTIFMCHVTILCVM